MSGVEPLILMQLATTAAGTAMSVLGESKKNDASQTIAEHDAAALETQAGQQRASAQRRAEAERERAERLMGDQRARAAASGGGLEGSVSEILGNTAARGEYNSNLKLWEGEEAAGSLDAQAVNKRYASKVGASGQGIAMSSTILSGVGSMAGSAYKGGVGTTPKYAYDMPTAASWKSGTTVKYG
jgi:hypothetical protein